MEEIKLDDQDSNRYFEEEINKITSEINCQNFIIQQNKIYCWDGNKFNLYKK